MIICYLITKRIPPRYAIIIALVIGFLVAYLQGQLNFGQIEASLAVPEFTAPHFTWGAIIGLGIPLCLVTLADQNATGLGVIRAAGYTTLGKSLDHHHWLGFSAAGSLWGPRRQPGRHNCSHLHRTGHPPRSAEKIPGRHGLRLVLPPGGIFRRNAAGAFHSSAHATYRRDSRVGAFRSDHLWSQPGNGRRRTKRRRADHLPDNRVQAFHCRYRLRLLGTDRRIAGQYDSDRQTAG